MDIILLIAHYGGLAKKEGNVAQQIKLEIEPESYEKVYGQLQALYEIANKASLAIEKVAAQNMYTTAFSFGLAGFGLVLLVGIFLVTI